MPASAFASLLIAFVAAAGAVPLLRDLLRNRPALHSAGGIAMALGVLVAAFYSDPWPSSNLGLVLGSCLLLAGGVWFDQRHPQQAGRHRYSSFEMIGSLVAAVFLFGHLDHDRVTWSIGFMMLAAASLLLPMAVSALDRLPTANPALSAVMVLTQLMLLVCFGAVNAAGGSRYSLYQEFAIVAIPVAGALIGCLIYLSSMPWRRQAGVAIGVGGLLSLGLLLSWGVLRLGSITAEVRGGTTALLWLVAVPVFELLRSWSLRLTGRLLSCARFRHSLSFRARRQLRSMHEVNYSAVALVTVQLLAGLLGIGLCAMEVSGYLMMLLLGVFALAYMLLPVLLSWRGYSSRGYFIRGACVRQGRDGS